MALRVALQHVTEYDFDRLVGFSPHVIRLRPAPHCRTPILGYSIKIEPEEHFLNWQQDPFGNYLARVVFPKKSRRMRVEVDLIAEMVVINPFDFFLEEYADRFPFTYPTALAKELGPYLEKTECGGALCEYVKKIDRAARSTVSFLVGLNQKLHDDISYVIRMEPGVQTSEETLAKRSGSCRDSGWLLVQVLRHLGLAARFVSGYIVQLEPDIRPLDGPRGPAHDFTDLHAWAEVYLPGAGWVGLDPTSGLFAGEGHIPLACSPEPASAAAVTGLTDPCESKLHFEMNLRRIAEEPRITKPYSDAEWAAMDELGRLIDQRLDADDVRLSMGGEPTFVSVDDMEGAEWNTAAVGPTKRKLAGQLVRRLKERFAAGGLLHYGQGKWYPGEILPRWALNCFWRRDQAPIWTRPDLFALEDRSYGADLSAAERFLGALARRLGVDPRLIIPGFEDVYYYLWREGTLPVNLDPFDTDLADDLERARLRKYLERGLEKSTGFALPIRWEYGQGSWRSGRWPLRRERMYLLPGDSAMGYRLPLESLPHVPPHEAPITPQRCLFEPRPELGDIYGEVARRYSQLLAGGGLGNYATPPAADALDPADDQVRTVLCAEPRDGVLYIFLPPLVALEHYLDLVVSIEATAADLDMPIVLEGYPPPYDWRLERLSVTPDPGVIEVNVHPATSWGQLRSISEGIYEDARNCRLGTEKFMLDGRHTGTGGGNHVTLGGPTPADSPFLRRPDLLRSLATFWQNHPSLSYLFSGMFIGPTSQAPRVDEARHENLYELEIAFQQMPNGAAPLPWVVDRLVRNLLVDSTGNTHRAEFCVDKLYSPETLAGRLGLVELRSFEMPPHPRMSLAQALLIRGLVARHWRQPYEQNLVRWGTELHDKYMLPHYLWSDFADVVEGLRRAGLPFQREWYRPFLDFRFPVLGTVNADGLDLEIRSAAEPWHVLGEETTSMGTARYVDSSVERVQVKVQGMTSSRHAVTCNGRLLPLRSTGRVGEYVAGVRYRAWAPPTALHPMIPVHSPLVFDIVDRWNGCSVGGCSYHVSHPGGRNYVTYPVNGFEAESRRIARFWAYGHTPGPMTPPVEAPSCEYPHTLDLRRAAQPAVY